MGSVGKENFIIGRTIIYKGRSLSPRGDQGEKTANLHLQGSSYGAQKAKGKPIAPKPSAKKGYDQLGV